MEESPLAAVHAAPRETKVVVGAIAASQYVNHAYLVLFPPLLTVLRGEFSVTLAALGIALGVQGATNTLFQLPFGHLADRYDRTLALGLSSVVGAAGVLIAAAAPSYAWLLVGQAVIGIGVAGHHPSHYPLISDATPDDLMGRAYSVYGFGGALGFATPPAVVAATLAAGYSWRVAVGAIGVVGMAYGLGVTGLFARRVSDDVTAPNVTSAATGEPLLARAVARFRSLAAARGVLALALLALVSSTASWGFTSYVVVFLADGYGLGLSAANLALTGSYIAGAVAVFLGGTLADRHAPGAVMLASYGAVTLLVALFAAGIVSPLVAVGLVLLVGATRALAGPARSKLTDALSAAGTTGTNFAVITIGVMLGNAIAPPAFGYLIAAAGREVAFGAVAATSLLAVLVTVWIVARVDGA